MGNSGSNSMRNIVIWSCWSQQASGAPSPGVSGGDAKGYNCSNPRIHSGACVGAAALPRSSSGRDSLEEGEGLGVLRPPN